MFWSMKASSHAAIMCMPSVAQSLLCFSGYTQRTSPISSMHCPLLALILNPTPSCGCPIVLLMIRSCASRQTSGGHTDGGYMSLHGL